MKDRRDYSFLSLAYGASWEKNVQQIATEANLRWILLEDMSEINSFTQRELSDSFVIVDTDADGFDWVAFQEVMVDSQLSASVIAVQRSGEIREDTSRYADFVIHGPLERDALLQIVDSVIFNDGLVQYHRAAEDSHEKIAALSDRELSILSFAARGAPNKKIASSLGVHIKTVERIRNVAYTKLNVRSTAEMTRLMTLAELHDFISLSGYRPGRHEWSLDPSDAIEGEPAFADAELASGRTLVNERFALAHRT